MSLLDTNPSHENSPNINRNVIRWSGYFDTSEHAKDHLTEQLKRIVSRYDKLVVSAKSDFVNRHFRGLFLFRFTVVLTDK